MQIEQMTDVHVPAMYLMMPSAVEAGLTLDIIDGHLNLLKKIEQRHKFLFFSWTTIIHASVGVIAKFPSVTHNSLSGEMTILASSQYAEAWEFRILVEKAYPNVVIEVETGRGVI